MTKLMHSLNRDQRESNRAEKVSDLPSLTTPDMAYSIKELLYKFTTGITPPVMRNGIYDEDATFQNYDETRNGDFDLADAVEIKHDLEQRQAKREQKLEELKNQKAAAHKVTMQNFNKWKKQKEEEKNSSLTPPKHTITS